MTPKSLIEPARHAGTALLRSQTDARLVDLTRDGNEAREGTNPVKADSNGNGVKDGKEDADRDKLNNAGEDQAGTDPLNPDTDGDGIKDGEEKAGEVVSFDGTTLTVRLFGGQDVSGTVDGDTWIDCGASTDSSSADNSGDGSGDGWWDDSSDNPAKVRARTEVAPTTDGSGADDPSAGDPGADDGSGDDPSLDGNSTDDPGADPGSGDDPSVDDGSGGCAPDVLKVGAVVSEASFSATPDGLFFDSIELKPAATP